MGQSLLPEHLVALEGSVLAEARQRFGLSSMPGYGIGRLQWNESLIKDGILSLVALSLVLPSGLLLNIPENAQAQPLNMNNAGKTRVPVYLHVLSPANNDSRRSAGETDAMERLFYQLALSSEQSFDNAIYTIKFAEFQKSGEGLWGLCEDYIPPLLQVGTSPFLMDTVNYLAQLLEVFHFQLSQEISAKYLSGENLFIAKQCLQEVYKLKHFFGNLKAEIHYHPYQLYEAMKIFYITLCLYQNCTPDNVEKPYLHEQFAACFQEITEPLMRQLQLVKSQAPYMPFKKNEGMYVINKLPKEAIDAKEVYFLIQKPTITLPLSIEGLKLAGLARLPIVHQMALHGIPFKKISRPPFQHAFGAEVEFFLINEGEEWDYALGEKSLAFYDMPSLEGISAYLYWRHG